MGYESYRLKILFELFYGMPGLPALEVKQKPSFDDYKDPQLLNF